MSASILANEQTWEFEKDREVCGHRDEMLESSASCEVGGCFVGEELCCCFIRVLDERLDRWGICACVTVFHHGRYEVGACMSMLKSS